MCRRRELFARTETANHDRLELANLKNRILLFFSIGGIPEVVDNGLVFTPRLKSRA